MQLLPIISMLLLIPLTSTAFDLEGFRQFENQYQCPTTHPEYKKVLTQLREIQSRIHAESNCQDYANNIKEMTDLVGKKRKNFIKTIKTNKNKMLTAQETEQLQSYASDVSEKVLGIIDFAANSDGESFGEMLLGTNRCVLNEKDKYDLISRSSSIVYETSNLLAQVAGPYGAPIAIGGSILAGVVKGVGSYLNKRQAFKFEQLDKRIFFAETLCLYYQYQVEIDKLIHPDVTLYAYKKLETHLTEKVTELKGNCPECAVLIESNLDKVKTAEIAITETQAAEIDKKYQEPLGSHTKHALGSLVWVRGEVKRFTSILDFPTNGIEPREIQAINTKVSKFLFQKSAPQFVQWYKAEANSNYSQMDRTISTLLRNTNLHTFSATNAIRRKYQKLPNSALKLVALAEASPKVELSPTLIYDFTNSYKHWKLLEATQGVVNEYCEFFTNSNNYPVSIKRTCENTNVERTKNRVAWTAIGLELARLGLSSPFEVKFYNVNLSTHVDQLGQKASSVIAGRIDLSNPNPSDPVLLGEGGDSFLSYNSWSDNLDRFLTKWTDNKSKFTHKNN